MMAENDAGENSHVDKRRRLNVQDEPVHAGDGDVAHLAVALPAAGLTGPDVELVAQQRLDVQPTLKPTGPTDPGLVSTSKGAYTDRECSLQKQEDDGDLAFIYVVNDNQPTSNLCLLHLKNIFSRQLPNMPKEYITRLVFDHRHRSVAVIKRNGTVMGGITYRPFPHARFGEIAFCAVTGTEQVKGFGTRLMNYTKEYARKHDRLRYFLTYADNNAVGYFLKQGFTKEITSVKEQWQGFIKEYDGGTLMEYVIHESLPYTRFPQMIRAQRLALDCRIRKLSKSHLVYPGLTCFGQEPRRILEPSEIPFESLCVGDDPGLAEPNVSYWEVAGVMEAGYNPADMGPPGPHVLLDSQWAPTHENLHRLMQEAVTHLQQHEDAWPFLEPVDVRDVPDYLDIIKDPIDLSKMEQRVKSGSYYVTLAMFIADFKLMKANCERYNTADTIYVKAVVHLNNAFEAFLRARTSWKPMDTGP